MPKMKVGIPMEFPLMTRVLPSMNSTPEPLLMRVGVMAELYTIELMQGILKSKEVPYMVTVMGINSTTWLLQMREGVQRKSPLRLEMLLSTAGYKFLSVVVYTDMEVELIQSMRNVVPAVFMLPLTQEAVWPPIM
jgi:hypothetical protein